MAYEDARDRQSRRKVAGRVGTIDSIRGITILWITAFHLYVDTRGLPGAEASPSAIGDMLASGQLGRALAQLASALVALPAYRLDLFLFVSGVVLTLGPARGARAFFRRRARAVLPNYWLGSVMVCVTLVCLAMVRAWLTGGDFQQELQTGSMLATTAYRFEPLDLLRSLSILGRFEDQRTMQVVAPSLWYVILVMQAYVVFPVLKRGLDRVGAVPFFVGCLGATWLGRWLVFQCEPLQRFDANATVLYFIPFRLAPLALGMSVATSIGRLDPAGRLSRPMLAAPALAVVMMTIWMSDAANRPGTLAGILGPILPMMIGLPALWILASAALRVPGLQTLLPWVGQRSLSMLVVQDVLRLFVGTALSLGASLAQYTWILMPVFLAAVSGLASIWHPLPERLGRRLWPNEAASQV